MSSPSSHSTRPSLPVITSAIPAFDYRIGLEKERDDILAAIERVLDSGQLILGREVAQFEAEFASYVGSPFAVGTSSGTDALIIALRAAGIGPGDEIITVANGPVPTVAAIRAVGAKPRFVDIQPDTLQLDPDQLCRARTSATRGVIPIHLYGWPAPIEAIGDFCQQHNLLLIEDCAQAHGTFIDQQHVGSRGRVGCFSFYPTKNLGAFGDAGMCVTQDIDLAEHLREQTCYGFRGDRTAHREGLNCRLDELQAACLRVRLRSLSQNIARRREIASQYQQAWSNTPLQLPPQSVVAGSAWHQYVIRVTQRSAWVDWLAQAQVGCTIHYSTPIHLMPAYHQLGYQAGDLPHTERACQQVLSVPIYPELSDSQVERIIAVVLDGLNLGLT